MAHGNYSKAAYHKTLTYFTAWNIYTTSSTVNTTFSLLVIRCKSVVQYDLISHVRHLHVLKITYFMSSGGWVGWSFTSLFSTITAISETKGQGWRVILLPSEGRLTIY